MTPAADAATAELWRTGADAGRGLEALTALVDSSDDVVGFAPDDARQTMVVLAEPGRVDDARRAVDALGPLPYRVQVRTGCTSSAELARLRDVAAKALTAPGAGGIVVSTDHATGEVVVMASDLADPRLGKIRTDAGPWGAIRVEHEPSLQTYAGSRGWDTNPHFGGSYITDGISACTAGFSVVSNASGLRGSTTAGHCDPDGGSSWYSCWCTNIANWFGVTAGQPQFPASDVQWLGGWTTYTNTIHVDPCCPTTRNVVGKGDPALASSVCLSGAITGAVCGGSITDTAAFGSLCEGCGVTWNLFVAQSSSGARLAQPGDSGGPVYNRWGNTGAWARGTIVGGNDAGTVVVGHRISWVEQVGNLTVLTTP